MPQKYIVFRRQVLTWLHLTTWNEWGKISWPRHLDWLNDSWVVHLEARQVYQIRNVSNKDRPPYFYVTDWFKRKRKEVSDMQLISNIRNKIYYFSTYYSYFPLAQCFSQVSHFAHYLIPCGVEYSLIAMAIFYKMLQHIGSAQDVLKTLHEQDTVTPRDDAVQVTSCRSSRHPILGGFQNFNW